MKRREIERTWVRFFKGRSRAFRDLLVILLLAVLLFLVSARFDLFNWILGWIVRHDTWQLDELFTVALFLAAAFAVYGYRRHRELREQVRRRRQAESEKALLLPELRNARANVSQLRKLLPVCSRCMKIRDEKGSWLLIDEYLELHYQTRLDTGLCHECARKAVQGD